MEQVTSSNWSDAESQFGMNMKSKLTGWQMFELGHKGYLIGMGLFAIIMLSFWAISDLYKWSSSYWPLWLLSLLLFGVLPIVLGIFSKVSGLEKGKEPNYSKYL